ncbi:MAG: hypothetical protein HGA83_09870, partial [Bacteroidales bacterium]|nr:hypothetical protein [Bacteroidales bacterium]
PLLEQIFITDEMMSDISVREPEVVKAKQVEYRISSLQEVLKAASESKQIAMMADAGKIFLFSAGLVSFTNKDNLLPLKEIIENEEILKCGYDLKWAINLFRDSSVEMKGYLADIELMHYLITPERSHKLEILSQSYLSVDVESHKEMVQADLFSLQASADEKIETDQIATRISVLIPLYEKLKSELEREELLSLYESTEMPLLYVLADMEYTGVKVDEEMLKEYGRVLSGELETIEASVRGMASDNTLNLSSPKQLGVILYEKLKLLPKDKKSSSKSLSTDEETLSEIINDHPIVAQILEYRNIKKLLSTYIEPLPFLISRKTGKIHTTYNQALTATGRLSSIKPNLQNIPIRTERGREIRKAFIPSGPGGVIMSADYSQIELRLMAHMSQDKDFIDAFLAGKDIHSATASKIFGIPEEQLTREQRNRAKVANFGIIYGISAFGLSQRLNIPRGDSKQLIEDYFRNYPGVKDYISGMIEMAKKNGFVTTIYGRKRYLPDIASRNPVVRGLAERNAVNAPIQGSAADIIKIAMVHLFDRLKKEGIKSKMVLQVHDELVFDVLPEEKDRLSFI